MSKLSKIIENMSIKENFEVNMSEKQNKIDDFKLFIYITLFIIFVYFIVIK
jgi:hypothetical protein